MSENPTPRIINRREFLRRTAIITGGIAVNAIIPPIPDIPTPSPQPPEQENKKSPLAQEQETEKTKEAMAIARSVIGIDISIPNSTDKYHGTEIIYWQNDEYFLVTAAHVIKDPHEIFINPDQIAVTANDTKFDIGTRQDWEFTHFHPNDQGEYGFAYLPIPQSMRKTLQLSPNNQSIRPIQFTSVKARVGERVAIIRKNLPSEQQFQYATIERETNLDLLDSFHDYHHEGEFSFSLIDEDGQHIVCAGMSGTPILRVTENGQVTNEALGLIISIPEYEAEDSFNNLNIGWGPTCSDQANVRPSELHVLTNQYGIPLGQSMRTKIPESNLPSKVKTVRWNNQISQK